jgi:hypothetical protein
MEKLNSGRASLRSLFIIVATILIPFLQMGLSFYLSIQVLAICTVLSFIGISSYVSTFITNAGLLSVFLLTAVMTAQTVDDVFFVFRQMSMFCLIIAALMHRPRLGGLTESLFTVKHLLIFIVFAEAVFCGFQMFYFSKGEYFAFPYDWFIINGSILERADLALQYSTRFRPLGTFGEPSYLALVSNLIFLIVYPYLYDQNKEKLLLLISTIAVNFLCGSLSGLVFFLIIVVLTSRRLSVGRMLASGVVVLLLMFSAIFFVEEFRSRIFDVLLAGEDRSAYVRIEVPLRMAAEVLTSGLAGVYPANIASYYQNLSAELGYDIDKISDNAFLNIIINYGWLGLFIVFGFILKYRYELADPRVAVLIFYAGTQNGSLVSIDKAFLVAFMLLMYKYLKISNHVLEEL